MLWFSRNIKHEHKRTRKSPTGEHTDPFSTQKKNTQKSNKKQPKNIQKSNKKLPKNQKKQPKIKQNSTKKHPKIH